MKKTTKLNLLEFQKAKLEVEKILEAKGGCGGTMSQNGSTSCSSQDRDCYGGDPIYNYCC
jgi:hypothetical protein